MRNTPWPAISLLLAACSSGPATNDLGTRDLAVAPDLAEAVVTDMARPAGDLSGCTDSPKQRPDGGVCVYSVRGKVVDEAGKALPDLIVSVCANVCFFGMTGPDGTFNTTVGSHIFVSDFAVNVHGRPDYATTYVRLPPSARLDAELAKPIVLGRLPKSGPTIVDDMKPKSLVSGDVTLTIPAGVEVLFDPEDLDPMHGGTQLRTLAVDPGKVTVEGTLPGDLIYAFSPFEAIFQKANQPAKVGLSFAKSPGWKPGTQVDVFEMTGLLTGPPPAGVWKRVAGATVDAMGRIVTLPNEGPTYLAWIALRPR